MDHEEGLISKINVCYWCGFRIAEYESECVTCIYNKCCICFGDLYGIYTHFCDEHQDEIPRENIQHYYTYEHICEMCGKRSGKHREEMFLLCETIYTNKMCCNDCYNTLRYCYKCGKFNGAKYKPNRSDSCDVCVYKCNVKLSDGYCQNNIGKHYFYDWCDYHCEEDEERCGSCGKTMLRGESVENIGLCYNCHYSRYF